jgi:riboflavin transporter FmnP
MGKRTVRWMIQVAILSALAAVIMFFDFAIPFLGPVFLKLDFSDIPALVGAFALGPIAGVMIEFLKIVLNLLLEGSDTIGIGELANFLIGAAFVLPASLIYFHRKTKNMALLGLTAGIVCMTLTGVLLNLFLLLPAYAGVMNMTMDELIRSFSVAIPYITDLTTGILLGIIPFNLFKGIVISVVVMLLYKRISPLLKSHDDSEEENEGMHQ